MREDYEDAELGQQRLYEEPTYFIGPCTCDHEAEEHGWGECGCEGCDCEAGWEE